MKEVALSRWRSRDCRDAVPTEASANFPGILEAGMDDLSESTLCWSVVGCGHDLGRGVLFSQGSLLKAVLLSFQHLQGEGVLCSWSSISVVRHHVHSSLTSANHWTKHHVWIVRFNFHKIPLKQTPSAFPLLQMGRWGIKSLKSLPLMKEQRNWYSHPGSVTWICSLYWFGVYKSCLGFPQQSL